MNLKLLSQIASTLITRSRFANVAGVTFDGKRDLYAALGYQRQLFVEDFRARYRRNAVAGRIVEAYPKDTWRGGGEVFDDEKPESTTEFEKAWIDLDKKFRIWSTLERLDILAGIGHYSVLLIGAPGTLDTELTRCGPEELAYLSPFAEDDATVERYDIDPASPRFGLPVFYNVKRTSISTPTSINTFQVGKRVHYTRLIHVADGLLDDRVMGTPRLERVWNLLDDLEKVTGGGAEAFWKRADQGLQLDIDPTITVDPATEADLQNQVDEYLHGLRRVIKTRGLTVNPLGSDVAGFKDPASAILDQISAGTGIPQRILMGSERGQLASTQDRSNWDDRVSARRVAFAEPVVLRPVVNRFIELGTLPPPANGEYEVWWSQLRSLDEQQRADLAVKYATINQTMGTTVVTDDEIRDRVLDMEPLDRSQLPPPPEPAPAPAAARLKRVAERIAGATLDLPALEVALTNDDLKTAERLVAEAMVQSSGMSVRDEALADDLRELREALVALAARPQPPINVTVQGGGSKRIVRNDKGLITDIVEEGADGA